MCGMLRAGNPALPRHRQALRFQAAPPGLVFQNFGKSPLQFFMHAHVRVAPPPNNSADLLRSNQLAALLNYRAADLPTPQQLRPASPQRISQAPPPRHSSRVRAWERVDAAYLRRRNASCCSPRACAGGPRG